MTGKAALHPGDLRDLSRLAVDATTRLADLVEAMHGSVGPLQRLRGGAASGRTRGLTGLVYSAIRGVTRLVGGGIDGALRPLLPRLGEPASSPRRDALVAALNGVLGDHLQASGNALAIPLRLRRQGEPLTLERAALAGAFPDANGRLLVLAHGLCLSDRQWERQGHEHGAALARDLGFTPVYLHYNTGRHISSNGRDFAGQLEALVREWPVPVEELTILGHSMGGLVTRSACHSGREAGHAWLRPLRRIVFLGTPHHGSPLERGGNGVDLLLGLSSYSKPLARLGKIRSAGVTDLRYGSLVDEDWEGRDRFASGGDPRRPVPLPEGVECFAVAATTASEVGHLRDHLLADGLVPLASALGLHHDPAHDLGIPESRRWIGTGMHHFDLLSRPEVYAQLRGWLAG
ncbi:MAG TPA: alpha/beta hydrolase [Thermoanaerobaculia bacterium]|nr:alpha/beta hydrolase [Thermoanaerobaculia bacterium]